MRRWCLFLVVLAALVYLLYTGTGAAGPGPGAAGPGPGAARSGAAGPGAAGPGAAGPGQVITGTGRVPRDKVTTAAALSEKCYQYTGLTAINTCCKMVDYAENNGNNILQCANTSTHIQYFTKHRSSPSAASSVWAGWRGIYLQAAETMATAAATSTAATTEERTGETEENMGGRGQYWVMLGDSHIRNVFEVLVKRISPRVKYRLTSFRKDEWRDIEHIYEKPWKAYHNETIDVVHLDVPLRLTFYWDPLHQLMSDLLHKWLTPPPGLQVPSVFIISDSVLHWLMRTIVLVTDRDSIDMNNQHNLLHHLRQLDSISQHTTVIFKMQDYIPLNTWGSYKNKNVDLSNAFSRFCLQGSNIVTWDSTLPLSAAYVEQCRKHQLDTPDLSWKCTDGEHVGYIIIETYVDMLMNYVCNGVLNVGDEYCLA